MTSTDDKTRADAITRLQEAEFSAPEILALLERAEAQGTIDRHTAGYIYRVTYSAEAGYGVAILGGHTGPLPADQAGQVRAIIDGPEPEAPAAQWDGTTPERTSHLDPRCTCDHTPGDPCNASCPAHRGLGLTIAGQDAAPAPAPVDLWNAEWPYPEFTAADVSALFTVAAEIIRARGYYEYESQGYADKPGVSIPGALKAAALERAQYADPQADPQAHYREAHDVAEDLETRLAAVLYMFGQLHTRTGIRDLSDQLYRWELGHYRAGPNPGQVKALALLEQAAAMFGHMADQAAPVTAAPGPGAS